MQQSGARGGILQRRGEWRKGAEKASDVRDGMEHREAQRIGRGAALLENMFAESDPENLG